MYNCPNCGTRLAKNLVEAIKDPEQPERCHLLPPVERPTADIMLEEAELDEDIDEELQNILMETLGFNPNS